jgi:hypothetical protein
MDTNTRLTNMSKARERVNRIEQGFFDGRFRPKVVPNKKKVNELRETRKKITAW